MVRTHGTRIWPFLLVLIFLGIAGLFVHELGHGLTTAALGGKFTGLYVWPGVQVWPDFGAAWNGEWQGNIGIATIQYGENWDAESWQRGLVWVMGSGANLLLASLALGALWLFRPGPRLRLVLAAETLMFVDLPLYTFLPLIGLRHFFVVGGATPEPLIGAMQMGVPGWVFLIFVAAASVCLVWGLIMYLRRFPLSDG